MGIAALLVALVGGIVAYYSTQSTNMNQMDMLDKQLDFNAMEAEKNREFWSEPERYDRMTSELGFNPDLAAASIMGAGASPTSAASSPNSPALANPASALGSIFSSLNPDMMKGFQMPAEIEHMQSQTNRNNVESEWIPLTHQAQIDMWNSQADLFDSESGSYQELARLYHEQGNWVEPLSRSQERVYRAEFGKLRNEAALALQQSITEESLRDLRVDVLKSEANVNNSQAALNGQLKSESFERTLYYGNLQASEYYRQIQEYWKANLANKFEGLPISSDMALNLCLIEAFGTDEDKAMGEKVWNSMLAQMRDMKDTEVQSNWENYGRTFLMNLGNDAANGVGNAIGNLPFIVPTSAISKVAGGAKSVSKSVSKSSSKSSVPQPGDVFRGSDGKLHKMDKYGNEMPIYDFDLKRYYKNGGQ